MDSKDGQPVKDGMSKIDLSQTPARTMDTCEVCDFRGEMIDKSYSGNGKLTFYRCPVCYAKYIFSRSKGYFDVKNLLEVSLLARFAMWWGLIFALAGIFMMFESDDFESIKFARKYTVVCLIIAIAGAIKYVRDLDRTKVIERRIRRYKEERKMG